MYVTKPYYVFILNLNRRTFHALNQLCTGLVTPNVLYLAVVFKVQKENITIGHTSSFSLTTTFLSCVYLEFHSASSEAVQRGAHHQLSDPCAVWLPAGHLSGLLHWPNHLEVPVRQ